MQRGGGGEFVLLFKKASLQMSETKGEGQKLLCKAARVREKFFPKWGGGGEGSTLKKNRSDEARTGDVAVKLSDTCENEKGGYKSSSEEKKTFRGDTEYGEKLKEEATGGWIMVNSLLWKEEK